MAERDLVIEVDILAQLPPGLQNAAPYSSPPELTPEQERRLWHRIDVRLIPILALLYFMSIMDRANIANARLEGLEKQLGLKGNQFNIVLTVWFVPYCFFESISNLFVKKLRPSKWLPGLATLWGLVMLTTGLVKNFEQLVAVRFLLGMTEAGLFPGMIYYLTCWYPRHMLQTRIGLFLGTASLAGSFSALIAYSISFMSGAGGLLGWSWIFILEGSGTVVVGLIAFLIMEDFPETAKFLTEEERQCLVNIKKMEYANIGEEEHFESRHVWAIVTDWQLWVHILIYWSITTPLYGIGLFFPTIINDMGYSATISQLLTIPPSILSFIMIYIWAYLSDKWRMRSPFIYLGLIFSLIGLSISASDLSRGVKYFGISWVAVGGTAALPGVISWLGNNLSGQYKRGIGMAVQVGLGNLSGTFASNIYRTQDAPRFVFGHCMEIMFVGVGFISVTATVVAYRIINKRRDKILQDLLDRGEKLSPQEIRKLGDKSPTFRYMI